MNTKPTSRFNNSIRKKINMAARFALNNELTQAKDCLYRTANDLERWFMQELLTDNEFDSFRRELI